jgi:hypothetical protein
MRRQLRPFYSPEELARVYSRPYDHTNWPDHIERVNKTAEILHNMLPRSVADLSCGDGAIVAKACLPLNVPAYLADYAGVPITGMFASGAPGMSLSGPIEKTIHKIPPVDVFVLSETLEHVEDPDGLLRLIRDKAKRLLMSTPVGEATDHNPEHYWGWDTDDIDEMLMEAGFRKRQYELITPYPAYYTFQIWRAL